MDWSREWAYFPTTVVISVFFWLLWNKFILKEDITIQKIIIWFIVSFFNTLGIDLLERFFEAFKIIHVLKISLGAWLFFVLAEKLKSYKSFYEIINSFRKDFKNQLGATLINYFLIGILIFLLT